MKIDFDGEKLRKLCNDQSKLQKKYGKKADHIRRRLDDLADIDNLSEVTFLPGKHHDLTGDKKGFWACSTHVLYQRLDDGKDVREVWV